MNPSQLLVIVLLLAVAPLCGAGETPMRIDAHIHIYDPTRPEGTPWPPEKQRALYKPHLVEDFLEVAQAAGRRRRSPSKSRVS